MVWCLQIGWIHRWDCLWMAFPSVSILLFVPVIPLDRSNFGLIFFRWGSGSIPQLGALSSLWICSLLVLLPLCWVFQLMSPVLCPGSLLLSWHLGLFSGFFQFCITHCYTPPFNFLTLCTSPPSPPTSHHVPLFFPSVPSPLPVSSSLYLPWLFCPLF